MSATAAVEIKKPVDGTEVRAIRMLGDLIRVCRDGEDGYRAAADRCQTEAHRDFFTDRSHQRAGFVSALQTLQRRHGEDHAVESGSLGGTLHRAWLEIRDTMTSAGDEEILDEMLRADCSAVQTYRDILDDYPVGLYPADASVIAFHLREIGRARDGLLACKNASTPA